MRLLTIHNMHCYLAFMREMREAIANDAFREWRQGVEAVLRPAGLKSRASDV